MKKHNPTLETYTDLQKYYDIFNEKFFNGKLPNCLITYQRGQNFMAYYSPKRFKKGDNQTDEIAMNPTAFLSHDKTQILQTLLHEMCHLEQEHFGKPSRGGYHNKEWGTMMKRVGLQPFGVGKDNYGKEVGQKMNDKIIEGGVFDQFIKSDEYVLEMWMDASTSGISLPELEAEEKKDNKKLLETKLENVITSLEDHSSFDSPVKAVLDYLESKNDYAEQVIEGVKVEIEEASKELGAKIKYSCGCSNIWSKTGLKSMCLKCKQVFIYNP